MKAKKIATFGNFVECDIDGSLPEVIRQIEGKRLDKLHIITTLKSKQDIAELQTLLRLVKESFTP